MSDPCPYGPFVLVYVLVESCSFNNAFYLFGLIIYVPVNNFSVMPDGPSWVEPVLSMDKCVLLKDTRQ